MVKGRGKNARQTRNLLLKMSSDNLIGPLGVLKEWRVQEKRIKVANERERHAQTIAQMKFNFVLVFARDQSHLPIFLFVDLAFSLQIFTRNVTTINGYVTGIIEAFDKHWNIVLIDVLEVWKRKKFHHCSKAATQSPQQNVDDDGNNDQRYDDELSKACMQRLQMLNIAQPTIAVKSLNRKMVECSRNVPKLLIRGEQIATVILDQQTTINPETEISSSSSVKV